MITDPHYVSLSTYRDSSSKMICILTHHKPVPSPFPHITQFISESCRRYFPSHSSSGLEELTIFVSDEQPHKKPRSCLSILLTLSKSRSKFRGVIYHHARPYPFQSQLLGGIETNTISDSQLPPFSWTCHHHHILAPTYHLSFAITTYSRHLVKITVSPT